MFERTASGKTASQRVSTTNATSRPVGGASAMSRLHTLGLMVAQKPVSTLWCISSCSTLLKRW